MDAGAEEKQKTLAAAAYNGRLDAIDTALHNAVCSGSLAAYRRGREGAS